MAGLRSSLVLIAIILATLIAVPMQWLVLKLGLSTTPWIPTLLHRTICRIMGIRIRFSGTLQSARPLLLLPNHVSWLDIPVIGSITPLSFVAKADVMGWPVIGFLTRLQRTIFVDRGRRTKTAATVGEMAVRLKEGNPIVLFAEGTSSDGNRVLPFRSALIGAIESAIAADPVHEVVHVQPVSIVYVAANGLPLGYSERHAVAWYGDMDLAPSIMEILRLGAIDVVISFAEAIPYDQAADRKAIARAAERAVRRMTADAASGRIEAAGAPPRLLTAEETG